VIYLLLGTLVVLLVYGPSLWVRYVLWRHSAEIEEMPGTGAELAQHLIERFELEDVEVKKGGSGQDYYSPDERIVSLSPEHYDGKSLTAVAVAAHEVGHAIQFCRDEPVSHLRKKYLGRAFQIRRIGTLIIMSAPLLTMLSRSPVFLMLLTLIGVITMLVSVLMYVAILPEEYDASFRKALPILESGYLPAEHIPAARGVLKACAYTYVAAALADVLSLWRWLRFLR
jgi:Zn-dependent membrane protease YugP